MCQEMGGEGQEKQKRIDGEASKCKRRQNVNDDQSFLYQTLSGHW